jgi:uncharacterized protein (DUF2132 family)
VREGAKSKMKDQHSNNPLHGITLEKIVNSLVEYFGWDELGRRIKINCFQNEPSVKSSLKFLRKTDWARKKVEDLYIKMKNHVKKNVRCEM